MSEIITPQNVKYNVFNKVLSEIKQNQERRNNGKLIAIPFPFDRFSKYIAGLQKRRYIIITANAKVGKTKITDFMFVYNPINFILNNPDCGLDIICKYFSLEISKEDKVKQLICHLLFTDYHIIISEDQLDSLFTNYIVEDKILRLVDALQPKIEKILAKVEFIDNIRNPYGIYKYIREWHEDNGIYLDKDNIEIPKRLLNNTDNVIKEKANKAVITYKPNNPDLFFEAITDHLGLLTTENNKTLGETIGNFSSNYCIKARDRWDAIIINIQQQAASQEGIDAIKQSMNKPSASGLGINKNTQQDVDSMYGLYAPNRIGNAEYNGYNIGMKNSIHLPLKDNHREFFTVLNRRGGASITTQLFFVGQSTYFKELPPPDDKEGMLAVDSLIKRIHNSQTP